jgi:AraC-like DNA-binding protein
MPQRTKKSEPGHSRVKSVIAGLALAGTVSLETVAKHLGTSPRTLQRRLNRRGICFWALVEQSRFEIAGALLRDTDLQVQEIATRLGYSTPGGFSRAFARWAGCSPSDFRTAPPDTENSTQNGAKWAEAGHIDQ